MEKIAGESKKTEDKHFEEKEKKSKKIPSSETKPVDKKEEKSREEFLPGEKGRFRGMDEKEKNGRKRDFVVKYYSIEKLDIL
jgi:hypothetical protein